jgi:uncharacterized membrane protein YdfJ with MMPL/SSD domain
MRLKKIAVNYLRDALQGQGLITNSPTGAAVDAGVGAGADGAAGAGAGAGDGHVMVLLTLVVVLVLLVLVLVLVLLVLLPQVFVARVLPRNLAVRAAQQ